MIDLNTLSAFAETRKPVSKQTAQWKGRTIDILSPLAFAAIGALAGAAFGPIGILIGGALGLTVGLIAAKLIEQGIQKYSLTSISKKSIVQLLKNQLFLKNHQTAPLKGIENNSEQKIAEAKLTESKHDSLDSYVQLSEKEIQIAQAIKNELLPRCQKYEEASLKRVAIENTNSTKEELAPYIEEEDRLLHERAECYKNLNKTFEKDFESIFFWAESKQTFLQAHNLIFQKNDFGQEFVEFESKTDPRIKQIEFILERLNSENPRPFKKDEKGAIREVEYLRMDSIKPNESLDVTLDDSV